VLVVVELVVVVVVVVVVAASELFGDDELGLLAAGLGVTGGLGVGLAAAESAVLVAGWTAGLTAATRRTTTGGCRSAAIAAD